MIDSIYNNIGDQLLGYMLIIIGSLLILIIMYGLFLDKYNKLVCGKETILAYIPVFNNYIIGKLLINKFFGYVMIIVMTLPLCIHNRYFIIFGLSFDAIICTIAYIKYSFLKNEKYALENNTPYKEKKETCILNIKPNIAKDIFNSGPKHIIPTIEEIENNVKVDYTNNNKKVFHGTNMVSDSKQNEIAKVKDPAGLFEPKVIVQVAKKDDVEEI